MTKEEILQRVNKTLFCVMSPIQINDVETVASSNGRIELLVSMNGIGYRCGFERNGKLLVNPSLYASRIDCPLEQERQALWTLCNMVSYFGGSGAWTLFGKEV